VVGLLSRIINGRTWIHERIVEKDIVIEDDTIKGVVRKTAEVNVDEVIDAKGAIVLPGLIDSHVHLRDGPLAYKESFESGTSSAVAGGFTVVLDMPNNVPPVSTPERIVMRKTLADKKIMCDVGLYAMPTDPKNVRELAKAGCVGFKIYTHKVFEDMDFSKEENLIELFEEIKATNLPLSIHAEDPDKIGKLNEKYDAKDHAKAHTEEAEHSMIDRILRLCQGFPLKIRFCHVSTINSIREISSAKEYNRNLSIEATPSHLTLDDSVLGQCSKICTLEPPLRKRSNVVALRNSMWRDQIDIIGTDHAPHALSEKLSENPIPGFPGLETAVCVLFTLSKKGFLPFSSLVRCLTSNPASFFGLKKHGSIDKGMMANLTFIRFVPEYSVDPSKFFSKAKFSPFEGFKAETQVERTIVRGKTAFSIEDGLTSVGNGKIVEPK
jgi:dihydroorotase